MRTVQFDVSEDRFDVVKTGFISLGKSEMLGLFYSMEVMLSYLTLLTRAGDIATCAVCVIYITETT